MREELPLETRPDGRAAPTWLWPLLGCDGPWTGERGFHGDRYVIRDGILRSRGVNSPQQSQTGDTFGFKWNKRDTFESEASRARMRDWLVERYGPMDEEAWLNDPDQPPLLLDAGCGAGLSALELFDGILPEIRYLGVDVSEAVDVAAERFEERGLSAAFMQADITRLPFSDKSIDAIFSEGVLHHTDSTKGALSSLSRLLKPGGHFLFYVYRQKGPVREFTDDYIRCQLQAMSPQSAWEAVEPLTQLGIALGKLDVDVDLPRPIDLLGIPAGRHNLQRLFYWHVAKAFYRPDLSFDEMNHINYDWFAPANAWRQTPEEVRSWCGELGLVIEREVIEEAGITIVARKAG